MYDVKQFIPSLYLLLALGFAGFCLAVDLPVLLVVSEGLLLVNLLWWKRGRLKPLPRWMSSIVTLLFGVYVMMSWENHDAIVRVGQFLLVLQLVKVFEQRGNRDYAQLIVLSLLLMVAGIISTSSMLVGLIMMAYLLLSLYCCLLFHLKVESEHAKAMLGLDKAAPTPSTIRQDARFFARSMTRLTGFVSAVSVVFAVLVFLFFPRGRGAGVLFGNPTRMAQAVSGFSEQLNHQSVARIQQNQQEVAWVEVFNAGKRVTGGSIYLRGAVYDTYDGRPESRNRFAWTRVEPDEIMQPYSTLGRPVQFVDGVDESNGIVQKFKPLRGIGVNVLFSIGGVAQIDIDSGIRIRHSDVDDIVHTIDPILWPIEYTVISTPAPAKPSGRRLSRIPMPRSTISAAIAEYARRPEVSGVDPVTGRPLIEQLQDRRILAVHEDIARSIEKHLQSTFGYTLDLTDVRSVDDDRDPLEAFLLDYKKGHCELFAGSMVLMCQSLGIQARVVTGFKCDEFNNTPGAGYFIVRQSHAHAWVEVLTPDGWVTFDPTSGNDQDATGRVASGMRSIRHLLDLIQHLWANNVVAYDAQTQTSLLERIELFYDTNADRARSSPTASFFRRVKESISGNVFSLAEKILAGMVGLMMLALAGFISHFIYERAKLRRRAKRMGLDWLAPTDARRMAAQLGFYDDLLRVLARAGVKRGPNQTPLEFARSLEFLPPESYRVALGITRCFYRVRYGKRSLTPTQRRRLDHAVSQLEAAVDR